MLPKLFVPKKLPYYFTVYTTQRATYGSAVYRSVWRRSMHTTLTALPVY
jgi:hypothetical protein